jgi:predicted nucleotidyltransferase
MTIEEIKNKGLLIYEVIAGSHSYGLNTSMSDIDKRGVFIEPIEYILGTKVIEQSCDEKQDYVLYALRKFIKLASDCNPNIIELLYTDESNILYSNEIGDLLLENRDLFLSQKAKYTFTGYAYSQLKKIQGHNHWINNPQPINQPTIEEFMVTKKLADIKIEENIDGTIEFISGKSQNTVTYFDIDAFRQKFRQWKQYWRWKEQRNPTRATLEAISGYDTKHAMHLIRLLLMGKEILSMGRVIVKRPDREFLLDVRNGKYTFQEIEQIAIDMMKEIESIRSDLPPYPNRDAIDKLLIQIYTQYYETHHV